MRLLRSTATTDARGLFNERSGTVIAMAITSQPQQAGFPLTFHIPESTGLPKPSRVKISQIRTLSVERSGEKIISLDAELVDTLVEGLSEIIST
jgi:mRNA interferase MazF